MKAKRLLKYIYYLVQSLESSTESDFTEPVHSCYNCHLNNECIDYDLICYLLQGEASAHYQ